MDKAGCRDILSIWIEAINITSASTVSYSLGISADNTVRQIERNVLFMVCSELKSCKNVSTVCECPCVTRTTV